MLLVQPCSRTSDATSQKSMSGELASQILHCVNNSATALEKLGEFKDAKEQCDALQLDPDNLKALLRASRISIAQGEFDEAELAIECARKVHGENRTADRQIRRVSKQLKDAKRAYRDSTSAAYRGALRKRAERKGPGHKTKTKGRHQRTPLLATADYTADYRPPQFSLLRWFSLFFSIFAFCRLSSPEKKTQKFVPPPVYLIDEWNEHLRSGAPEPGGLICPHAMRRARAGRPICCTYLLL